MFWVKLVLGVVGVKKERIEGRSAFVLGRKGGEDGVVGRSELRGYLGVLEGLVDEGSELVWFELSLFVLFGEGGLFDAECLC